MKLKKKVKIILLLFILIIIGLSSYIGIKKYLEYLKIKNAVIEITYKEDLTTVFSAKDVKVSDFIESINGNIINDYTINTMSLGSQTIKYEYINNDDIKLKQDFKIEVVDKTRPLIWLGKSRSIAVGSKDTLVQDILCADDLDSNPYLFQEI